MIRYLAPLILALSLGCTTKPKPPEPAPSPSPAPSGSPSPTPSPSVGAVPMGQKLKIYYAQDPTTLKKGWGAVNVYDTDSRLYPQFRVKVTEAAKAAPNAINCGYIPIGYSDSKSIHVAAGKYVNVLTQAEINGMVDDWLTLIKDGKPCVFGDMLGFDYAYTSSGKSESQSAKDAFRKRQLDTANYIHSKGAYFFWNAWRMEDLPWEKMGALDLVLLEDAQSDTGRGYARWKYAQEHRKPGTLIYAVTTGSYDKASLEAAAKKYGVSGIQYKTNNAFENED